MRIFESKRPFDLQNKCPLELFRLGLIDVQKCALFALFHGKSQNLMDENVRILSFFQGFDIKMAFRLVAD